jgi:hypothetical protein
MSNPEPRVIYGIILEIEDFKKIFDKAVVHVNEVGHYEKRFDSKTGKPIKDKYIVDVSEKYTINGEEVTNFNFEGVDDENYYEFYELVDWFSTPERGVEMLMSSYAVMIGIDIENDDVSKFNETVKNFNTSMERVYNEFKITKQDAKIIIYYNQD